MEALMREKLSRLEEYLRFLRELKAASLEAFMTDFRSRGAAERYLQLAIESVIDIGSEIISFLQLRRPERYRDIPPILAQARSFPPNCPACPRLRRRGQVPRVRIPTGKASGFRSIYGPHSRVAERPVRKWTRQRAEDREVVACIAWDALRDKAALHCVSSFRP